MTFETAMCEGSVAENIRSTLTDPVKSPPDPLALARLATGLGLPFLTTTGF